MSLGTNIRNLRESFNISRTELATVLNIKYSTFSNYENDIRIPELEVLRKIAHYFSVPVESLIQGTSFKIPFTFITPPEGVIPLTKQHKKPIVLANESLTTNEELALRAYLAIYRSGQNN